jgi:hypothetical protein
LPDVLVGKRKKSLRRCVQTVSATHPAFSAMGIGYSLPVGVQLNTQLSLVPMVKYWSYTTTSLYAIPDEVLNQLSTGYLYHICSIKIYVYNPEGINTCKEVGTTLRD